MRRLLVNDFLTTIPGTLAFWHNLQEWFSAEDVMAPFPDLVSHADLNANGATLIIRNATFFGPLKASEHVPTISLLQDIIADGPQRAMQEEVMRSSKHTVFNSEFTASKYPPPTSDPLQVYRTVIPLPVDFSIFEPQNAMGCQQALGLPDGCVCWIGASQDAAAQVKGWDIMQQIARRNPDLHFICVFKDALPESMPPNMRCYERLTHEELVRVIGACRVGLCTSRMESQHLAGVEMGACGLPMIAPPVGIYWKGGFPGVCVADPTVQKYSEVIRLALTSSRPAAIREHWQERFDIPVIKSQWEKLVAEVECSGR